MSGSKKKEPLNSNKAKEETTDLASKIRLAKKDSIGKAAANAMRQREMAGAGKAFRMMSEFISAIIVGGVLGFAIDAIFGTRPFFLIVLLLLGFSAGVLNVVRAASELNANTPKPDPDKLVPFDNDDDD